MQEAYRVLHKDKFQLYAVCQNSAAFTPVQNEDAFSHFTRGPPPQENGGGGGGGVHLHAGAES